MKRTRAVFLIHDLGEGGAQSQLLLLVRGLDRRQFAPVVVGLRPGGAWRAAFRAAGAHVLELPRSQSFSLRRVTALARLLRRLRPDVVHSINAPGNVYARLALWLGRPASRPVVIASERGRELGEGGLRARVNRLAWRRADAVLCNSTALAAEVRDACPAARVAVVPNGIAIRPPAPCRDPEEPVPAVVAVGRMVPEKNFGMLLLAAARLREHGIAFHLRLVGDGPLRAELEHAAVRLGLRPQVSFAAPGAVVARELERADVLALSSATESSPNVVLEAMERGLPVVATDVGDVRALVQDGATGFVVPPGREEHMAEALEALLLCPESRARMGAAGRARAAAEFPAQRTVADTLALWRQCGARLPRSGERVAFLPIFVNVVHWFAAIDRELRRRGADAVHLSLFHEDWNHYRREGLAAVARRELQPRLSAAEARTARRDGLWQGIPLDPLVRYDLLRHGARGPRLLPRLRLCAARYLAGFTRVFARTEPTQLVVTGDSWTAVRCAVAIASRRGIAVTYFEQGPYGTTVWDRAGALANLSFAGERAPAPLPGVDVDPLAVFPPRPAGRWRGSGCWSSRLAHLRDAAWVRVPLHLWPLAPVDLASAEPLLPPRGRLKPQRRATPPPGPYVFLALQVPNDVQVVLHSPHVSSLEQLVRVTLDALPPGHRLVVKEHPNQAGRYPRGVYAALRDPRAVLVDGVALDDLIDHAAAVVVLNSTVGLDALRRGRTVVTLGTAFYTRSGLVHPVAELAQLRAVLARAVSSAPDRARIAAYLRLLRDRHLVPGHFTDDPPANVPLVVERLLAQRSEPQAPLPLVRIPRPDAVGAAPTPEVAR